MISHPQKGITIVELILYIAISSIVLLSLVSFYHSGLQASVKTKAIHQIQSNSQQISTIINNLTGSASGITSPTPGTTSTSIAITTDSTERSPLQISKVGDDLVVSEDTDGTNETYSIVGKGNKISSVVFYNVSTGTSPSFQYTIKLQRHTNAETSNEFFYENTIHGSITGK